MEQIKAIKLNMSQIFTEEGKVIPVTIVNVTKYSQELNLDLENKDVVVIGTSKGKGFTGVMKKWNFRGAMATRGQKNKQRAPGSIGSQTPGRVLPGKKMAGRHGNYKVTIKGLKIVKVLPELNQIMVSGPVPGARNSLLTINLL